MSMSEFERTIEIIHNNRDSFFEWYNFEAPEESRQLYNRASEFEDLFKDMIFKEGASADLVRFSYEDSTEDEEYNEELMEFTVSYARFNVTELEAGTKGQFNSETFLLSISPEYVNEDSVLLHEMIHLYESVINNAFPLFYHDMLLYSLYSDLKNKLPDLDDLIKAHAHILTQDNLTRSGGVHDVLFLLKSFDIDLRMGYQLGTVFGYGRAEEYKEYRESV